MKDIRLMVAKELNKMAKELVAKDYEYIYDPDHKKHPGGGFQKTEKGWQKGKQEKKDKGTKNNSTSKVSICGLPVSDADSLKPTISQFAKNYSKSNHQTMKQVNEYLNREYTRYKMPNQKASGAQILENLSRQKHIKIEPSLRVKGNYTLTTKDGTEYNLNKIGVAFIDHLKKQREHKG